jgi:sulfur-carrier protein
MTVRVLMPAHLRTIAKVKEEVALDVPAPVTIDAILDALERAHPALQGTIRDHVSKKRRPFIRFFACSEDWSHEETSRELPPAIRDASEPFLIVGAVAGGIF